MPGVIEGLAILINALGVGAAGAGAASALAVKVATLIVVGAATTLGNYAINKIRNAGRRSGQSGYRERPRHTVTGEVVPARWVLGRSRVPGVLAYFGSSGKEATMVLVLSEDECEKIDGTVWVDGEPVKLIREQRGAQGDRLTPNTYSKYHGHLEIFEYFRADGTQGGDIRRSPATEDESTEYRDSLGNTGNTPGFDTEQVRHWTPFEFNPDGPPGHTPDQGVPDPTGNTMDLGQWSEWEPWSIDYPPWTADHRMMGVSYVAVKLTQSDYGQDIQQRLFTRVPNIEFLLKGIKLSWPGQLLKIWTENAAAIRFWWETVRRGRPASAIHVGDFNSAFALCGGDVTVELPNGYEGFDATSKRYAINGMVESGDAVDRVEAQMDAAWAGQVVEIGGVLRFLPGAPRPTSSVIEITEENIVEGPVVVPWVGLQERVNSLNTEVLQSREHDWTPLSLPEYIDAAALARDGHKRPSTQRLELVADPIAAGRLQAINLRRQRESLRVQFAILPGENFEHVGRIPGDIVEFTSAELGLTEHLMEVEQVAYREDYSVELKLREVLDGTYEDTLVLPGLLPRPIKFPITNPVQSLTGLTSDEVAETQSDGTTLIHLLVTWGASASAFTEVQSRRKTPDGEADLDWESFNSIGENVRIPNVLAGETYEFRGRHFDQVGANGAWSEIQENTIDGDLTPPGPCTALMLSGLSGGFQARWTNPSDDDFAAACIYTAPANDFTMAKLVGTVAADIFSQVGLIAGERVWVWVRAKDRAGNLGPPLGPSSITPGLSREIHPIATWPPSNDLGNDGDTAIAGDGRLGTKVDGSWVLVGDLTSSPSAVVHFIETALPTMLLGSDGDVAVNPVTGQIWDKVSGSWVERQITVPAPSNFRLSSVQNRYSFVNGIAHDVTTRWAKNNLATEVEVGVYSRRDPFPPTAGVEALFDDEPPQTNYSRNEVLYVNGDRAVFRDVNFLNYRIFRARHIPVIGQPGPYSPILRVAAPNANAPAIASFTAIVSGGNVKLSWRTSDANMGFVTAQPGGVLVNGSITADYPFTNHPLPPGVVASGSITLPISQDGLYQLTVWQGNDFTVNAISHAVVNLQAGDVDGPSITFAADDPYVLTGGSTHLRWSVTGANSNGVSIDQDVGIVNLEGELEVTPAARQTWRITAVGPGGTTTADVTVNVGSVEQPRIVFFRSSRGRVNCGRSEGAELSWETVGATEVSITPGVGGTLLSGRRNVFPGASTNYVLTATNAAGSVTASVQVDCDTGGDASISSFRASRTSVTFGQSVDLSWAAQGGSVVLRPLDIVVPFSGTRSVTPRWTTRYTLNALPAPDVLAFDAERSVTVSVIGPAVPLCLVGTDISAGIPSLHQYYAPGTVYVDAHTSRWWRLDFPDGFSIEPGQTVRRGTSVPASSLGRDGDVYFVNRRVPTRGLPTAASDARMYRKIAGAWVNHPYRWIYQGVLWDGTTSADDRIVRGINKNGFIGSFNRWPASVLGRIVVYETGPFWSDGHLSNTGDYIQYTTPGSVSMPQAWPIIGNLIYD